MDCDRPLITHADPYGGLATATIAVVNKKNVRKLLILACNPRGCWQMRSSRYLSTLIYFVNISMTC